MKTATYLRVSTEGHDLDNQRFAILDYAHRAGVTVDEFIEVQVSSRRVLLGNPSSPAKRIRSLLATAIPKSSVARILGVSRTTLSHFIQTRELA